MKNLLRTSTVLVVAGLFSLAQVDAHAHVHVHEVRNVKSVARVRGEGPSSKDSIRPDLQGGHAKAKAEAGDFKTGGDGVKAEHNFQEIAKTIKASKTSVPKDASYDKGSGGRPSGHGGGSSRYESGLSSHEERIEDAVTIIIDTQGSDELGGSDDGKGTQFSSMASTIYASDEAATVAVTFPPSAATVAAVSISEAMSVSTAAVNFMNIRTVAATSISVPRPIFAAPAASMSLMADGDVPGRMTTGMGTLDSAGQCDCSCICGMGFYNYEMMSGAIPAVATLSAAQTTLQTVVSIVASSSGSAASSALAIAVGSTNYTSSSTAISLNTSVAAIAAAPSAVVSITTTAAIPGASSTTTDSLAMTSAPLAQSAVDSAMASTMTSPAAAPSLDLGSLTTGTAGTAEVTAGAAAVSDPFQISSYSLSSALILGNLGSQATPTP